MTNRDCHGDLYTLDGARYYRCLLDGTISPVTPEIAGGVCANCRRNIYASELGAPPVRRYVTTEYQTVNGSWIGHSQEFIQPDQLSLRNRISCLRVEDGMMADNLAIALCTYFEDHPECPPDAPEDENGWKLWAVERANRVLDEIAVTALGARLDEVFLIFYEDADKKPEVFLGHGARDAARRRFEQIGGSWNAHLFQRIEKNHFRGTPP